MKRIKSISLVIALFMAFMGYSQDLSKINQWSVGLNIGGHDATKPTKTDTKFFTHVTGDVRYMVNNRFGVMGDIGYGNFAWKTDTINNTHLLRFSLQGVVNLADILRFDTWTTNFGLLAHGGAGYSRMWQKDRFNFNEADEMGNFIVGITPQYKITERVSVNLDWSGVFHGRQHRTFDFKSKTPATRGVNGFYMTASAGVKIYLGKNEKHADWVPSEFGGSADQGLLNRIAQLEEQAKDDDNDGVPNSRDIEANTPAGSVVNSKGQAVVAPLDSDNDGIIDAYDMCPNEKGQFSTNGCPDSDNDGVMDSEDRCPNTAGLVTENGCPKVDEESKKVFDEALHGINFETGKDVIKASSFPVLDKVVDVMKKHPEFSLEIAGHTDNVGAPEKNLELSKNRASSVMKYLESKGVDAERMNANGFGQTQPASSNDTEAGRANNRRVEFIVLF